MSWILGSPQVETLGGVLLQFIWQGALIAVALRIALWILDGRPAAHRYVACCAAMFALLAVPAIQLTLALAPSAPAAIAAASRTSRLLPYSAAIEPLVHSPISPILPWAVVVWALGVALLSVRVAGGWLKTRRLANSGVTAVDTSLHARARQIARSLGVTRDFGVLQSALAEIPGVVGWIKPVVLIPAALVTGLPASQVECLIAHEIAHIRRHDYLVNLLQTAVEILLFYHPAVWWTSRQIRRERENCCDDLAVAACGDAMGYARALAELERMRSAPPRLAMAASGGDLLQRTRRLVVPRSAHSARPGPALVLGLAALAVAGVLVTRPAGAQSPGDAIADTLFSQLHARNWVVEGEVKKLLGEIRASGNIEPFLNALKSRRDWQSREKAAWVLGMTGNAAAVDGLVASLRDESPAVQHTAAWALGRIGDARAIDPLIENLRIGPEEARAGAVWALGSIGDARAVDAVVAALSDSNPDVRTAAAWALGAIGDARAKAPLERAVQDPNREVRKKASEALSRLQP